MQYKWIALTVTTIGVLMVGIDLRIVIVGLPQVAEQLHANAVQAIWITQSYVLATTIMLVLIGRLVDIIGRVRLFVYGFAIFTIGSGLIAAGTTPLEVIIFRGVEGFGASMILANALTIVTDATPKNQLGFAVGINQISFRAGAILGLVLSGLILSFFAWQALFLINIPIGIFGTYWAHRSLKEIGELEKNAKVDWIGFVLFTVFLLSLMLGLTFATYGSSMLEIVYVLLPVSGVFLLLFGLWERRTRQPLVDLNLFKIKEFVGGSFARFFNIITLATVLLLLSLQFQLINNESPLSAGLRILPFEVAFLAVGPLSGRLSDKYGHKWFTLSGLIVATIALYLFSTANITTPYIAHAIYMILFGVGIGLFLAPNMKAVMGSLPANRRGIGSAVFVLMFNIGLTLSLNLAILFMSFTVPYEIITNIIGTANPATISAANKLLFLNGLQSTYFAMMIINIFAIPFAILGAKSSPSKVETSKEQH